ncbi:hypothetical protein MalM25_24780 [Planctomycetes bacterium MalM25]|nr:hypothetical protein MalM25_24780 [Planctomycetes bacterium MalM25]
MLAIREASPSDRDAIRAVHALAFAGPEAEPVAKLAVELLDETGPRATLNLVAESTGELVGHVAFSPVAFAASEGLSGYLLAPLGVRPDHQMRRVGTQIVEEGINRLRGQGVDVLLVYGDPAYYGRFGFTDKNSNRFVPPYELEQPFGWLTLPLREDRLPKGPMRLSCVEPLCDPGLW